MFFHEFASWSPASLLALAGMAQPDEWAYRHTSSERPLPILRNYVVYTFRRTSYLGLVAQVQDEETLAQVRGLQHRSPDAALRAHLRLLRRADALGVRATLVPAGFLPGE